MSTKDKDIALMNVLHEFNVTELNRLICITNMGNLILRVRKSDKVYRFVLDSVELPQEKSDEIMKLLFEKPKAEPEVKKPIKAKK